MASGLMESVLSPRGMGIPGGGFAMRFNVLRGDVNQGGSVGVSDVLYVRNAQFTAAAIRTMARYWMRTRTAPLPS